MREISTPTGSFTSLAFTAAATAAAHERGDAPVASVRRTTEAAELLGRAGIGTGSRALCRGPLRVTVRAQFFRFDRWQRRDLGELVHERRDARAQHLPRLGARARREEHAHGDADREGADRGADDGEHPDLLAALGRIALETELLDLRVEQPTIDAQHPSRLP